MIDIMIAIFNVVTHINVAKQRMFLMETRIHAKELFDVLAFSLWVLLKEEGIRRDNKTIVLMQNKEEESIQEAYNISASD